MKQDILAKKLERINDLPGLPSVVFETIHLLDEPGITIERLISSIQLDQAIVSKLLRLVNSSFYGFQGKIGSLSQALVLLGFNAVRNAVLSISILDIFSGINKDRAFDPRLFWLHAIGTGVISRVIGHQLKYPRLENLFVAGLLHDIGKLVIIKLFPEDFPQVLKEVKRRDISIIEGESAVLGINHTEIGHKMAENWRLPEEIQEAVALHHCPWNASENRAMSATVSLSDCLCRALDIGYGGDSLVPEIDPKAVTILGVEPLFIAGCLEEIDLEMERAKSFLAIFS
jgi:putative nucleotidyltransferase with HDIG domain